MAASLTTSFSERRAHFALPTHQSIYLRDEVELADKTDQTIYPKRKFVSRKKPLLDLIISDHRFKNWQDVTPTVSSSDGIPLKTQVDELVEI